MSLATPDTTTIPMDSTFITKGAALLTSAPASGAKRKRSPSTSTNGVDTVTIENKARAHKKCRYNTDEYNVKYMASMCFSAHATRQHNAGLLGYTKDEAQIYRENLIDIFNEVQSGALVEHCEKARSIIPLIARKASSVEVTDEMLTNQFIAEYDCIRCELGLLDVMMGLDHRIEESFLGRIYQTVFNVHHGLSSAVMWHDFLPYTPLSLKGLRDLRDHIRHSEDYHPLLGLLAIIDDIERWLSLPPLRMESFGNLKKAAMEAMQEETEKKVQALRARFEAERPEALRRQLAKIKEEQAKKESRQKETTAAEERRQALMVTEERQKARRLAEQQAEAQRQQMIAEQQKKEQREAEAEAAEKRLQEEKKKQEEDALRKLKIQEAKAAEQKLQEEKKLQEQNKLQEAKRQEEDAERKRKGEEAKAAELEKQKRGKEQQEYIERTRQEAVTAKDAEREQLRAKGESNKKFLHAMISLLQRGNITPAELQALNVPTKEECHTVLIGLWSDKGALIESVLTHQLLVDPDLLLELDCGVMSNAQVAMLVLKGYGRDPYDLINTGWQLPAMLRLQSELGPYAHKTGLSSLKFAVDHVCEMLQEADRELDAQIDDLLRSSVSTQSSQSTSLASSMSSNTTANTEQTVFRHSAGTHLLQNVPAPMPGVQKMNPLLDPNRTPLDQNGLPIPHPDPEFVAQYSHVIHPNNSGVGPGAAADESQHFQPYEPREPSGKYKQACRFFKQGNCTNGDNCTWPHAGCRHFLKGSCKFGDNCKGSHDPFFLGEAGPNRSPQPLSQVDQASSPADLSLAARIAASKALIPCRDGDACTRGRNCFYKHD